MSNHLLPHLLSRALDSNGIDPNNINTSTTDPLIIAMSRRYCTVGKCPESWQVIEYRPNLVGNVIYMLCFSALLCGQAWFGVRGKTWAYMGTMCTGVLGEVVGYGGRIGLWGNPFSMNMFLVNLIPLTIAPALITAGIYLSLHRVITVVGVEHSRIRPKWYAYLFVGCDLLALVLQGAGGGIAATARSTHGSRQGVNIMIAGLISQVITMLFFLALWADFIFHVRRRCSRAQTPPMYASLRSSNNFKYFQWSLFAATILIFTRSIYRVAELWDGFSGKLANHEATFMVFEGPMVFLAVGGMTAFHPGRVFGRRLWVAAGKAERYDGKILGGMGVGSEVQLGGAGGKDTVYEPLRGGEA